MAEWFTFDPEDAAGMERLVLAWQDAPITNPEVCGFLLEVAQEQVIAFAPDPRTAESSVAAVLERFGLGHKLVDVLAVLELDDPSIDPPTRYVFAQLSQATNLWNAGRVASDGTVGAEPFSFTPRPLDKTIKAMIRPIDGKPHVL